MVRTSSRPLEAPNRAIDHWAIADSDVMNKGAVSLGAWVENDAGQAIRVQVEVGLNATGNLFMSLSPDGGTTVYRTGAFDAGGATVFGSADVPPGWSYRITANQTLASTVEHNWFPIIGATA